MEKILIINTGGTFNKIYNPKDGILEIDKHAFSLDSIISKWLNNIEIKSIINKDSLEINSVDRQVLLSLIETVNYKKIIVVHGTDTMNVTASYLADATLNKTIILTGAMTPYSIDTVEATANLASAYGFLCATAQSGIYICMNGNIGTHDKVSKQKELGKFTLS